MDQLACLTSKLIAYMFYMSDHYTLLVSNNISEEERRRRRKRKRVVVALVVSIMALIAKRYHRRRPRHLANANEVLERRVQERKQMLRENRC